MFLRLTLIGTVCLQSCMSARSGSSDVNVTNGVIVTGKFAENFPLIKINIDSSTNYECSGVIVGPNVVATAAHCLPSVSQILVQDSAAVSIGEIKSTKIISPPEEYRASTLGSFAATTDLAFVVFPSNSFESSLKIDFHQTKVGDEVQIFGYGGTDARNPNFESDVLRSGTNKIESLEDGMIIIDGLISGSSNVQPGVDSATVMGDSGGALLSANKSNYLIGITSSGRLSAGIKQSRFVPFSSKISQFVYCQAVDQGALVRVRPLKEASNICMQFNSQKKCSFELVKSPYDSVQLVCRD